jgi:hypothetical protein
MGSRACLVYLACVAIGVASAPVARGQEPNPADAAVVLWRFEGGG